MIKWDKSYALGIPLIDAQHQKLFEIAGSINELLSEEALAGDSTFDILMDAQEKLFDYTKYHFSQEEKLMLHYGYTGIPDHIKEHQDFIRYIDEFDYSKLNKDPHRATLEMLKFVVTWILNHIMKSDFAFKDHVIKAMQAETTNFK